MSKLTDADGEQLETQHWVEIALDSGYISGQAATEILDHYAAIGRTLHAMIIKAHTFCSTTT